MLPLSKHATAVDHWIDQANGLDSSHPDLQKLLIKGFTAVWRRANVTLGEITLSAIGERVIYTCSASFPWLKTLKIRAGESLFENLPTAQVPEADVRAGLRQLLIELFSILGTLTGEALTPQLYLELSKIIGEEHRSSPAEPQHDPHVKPPKDASS